MPVLDPKLIGESLEALRRRSPLVHNITNYVAMNFTANVLLAAGASPVMAHASEEVESMVSLSSALVVNIGTLSEPWIQSMLKAMRRAKAEGIPIVLDPVGVGATPYRDHVAALLLREGRPDIIRGNASEIMALAGGGSGTKGVDSVQGAEAALAAARAISREGNCVVCVSGKTDFIVAAEGVFAGENGDPMMTRVTAVGCAVTALIGAFAAVCSPPAAAALAAMATMGVAGELAAAQAAGPGSFAVHFLDSLYGLSGEALAGRVRVSQRA